MADKAKLGSFLKNVSLQDYIIASAKGALGGQTPNALRQYSFSFSEQDKSILFKAEVDRELTKEERSDLSVVETEIYSDFADGTMVETIIEIVPNEMPLHPLSGGVVYRRDS